MKNIFKSLFAVGLIIILPFFATACDILVATEGTQKQKYKEGDVIVIKITVILKHRNCEVDINETDIRVSGLQILAATKWTNTREMTWERKIRVSVLKNKEGKAVITAERTCSKDGGKGSLTIPTDG